MSYDPPDAQNLKIRFPEFEDLTDSRVQAVIEEASRFVDSTWIEADYAPAIRFLAAHMLVTEGALSSGAAISRVQVGPVVSETLGDASITYGARVTSQAGGHMSDAELATTGYGQRFLDLRNANHPAILTVGAPSS